MTNSLFILINGQKIRGLNNEQTSLCNKRLKFTKYFLQFKKIKLNLVSEINLNLQYLSSNYLYVYKLIFF